MKLNKINKNNKNNNKQNLQKINNNSKIIYLNFLVYYKKI